MSEDVPPELRTLFEAERSAVPEAAVRAAVRSRLTLAMAHGGLGLAALKILSVLVLVAGAGALVAVSRGRSGAVPEPAAATIVVMPAIEPPRVEVAPVVVATRVATPVASHRRVVPARAPHEAAEPASEPSEAALLGLAWRALPTDPGRALAFVERSSARFADGPLSEEREVIRIQAVAAIGRAIEAHDLAARFLAAYPHSIHRPLVHDVQEATR